MAQSGADHRSSRQLGGGRTPRCWAWSILALLALVFSVDVFDIRHMGENVSDILRMGNGTSGVVRAAGWKSRGDGGRSPREEYEGYAPSPVERYFWNNSARLGWGRPDNPATCPVWKDPNLTTPEIFGGLQAYAADLDAYHAKVRNFTRPDGDRFNVWRRIKDDGHHGVCDELRLHPDGLPGIFASGQLSRSRSGWVEPLTPPMRSHQFCFDGRSLMSLDYLVHDFEHMCRELRPTSRLVLIDMGAALDFHGAANQPIVTLMRLYEKFGFRFEHIYGFEVKFTSPEQVYGGLLPREYFAAYHWINTAVSPEVGHKMNPLHSILQGFSEEDFVVVKLDVDTASVEVPLAYQLLEGGPDGIYHRLVDHFYFEHHVHLGDLARWWGGSMNDTVKASLDLFYGLRQKGIPSHFWP